MGKSEKDQAPPAPKIVGPNITGKREEYRLERRLQSGLFGGVYEAKGLSSQRLFAVKVLHRSELTKAQRAGSLEFCEVPLSEIKFMDVMRGHDHVMQVEDHFEDNYCHYIVFELARGGDLLEALKLRPTGFEEQQAQFLIGQAARGLAVLHDRRLAMQDVSLENMLLHVLDDGEYRVKVCDPGQAMLFDVDSETGEELPVRFHGFVGKSFRPPEIHQKQPYLSTKVDAWCLGWSTFYLLAAQPLFLSADPAQQDPDWELFQRSEFATLFRQKATSCSQQCMDFILGLLQIDPKRRMSVQEALQHEWLRDSNARPMYAPKEIMPPPETLAQTPEKRNSDNADFARPLPTTPTNAEGGAASPAAGGSLNGNIPKEELRAPGINTANAGYGSGFRGGLTGSLGGGLSAGGHFSSGGGPGGLGTGEWQGRQQGGQQSGLAPAWKMAPPSRSDSPGPGSNAALRPGYYQGAGSAGTPTPNQYAPLQARTSSPFGSAPRGAGQLPLQRRSPSPPPRQNTGLIRGTTGSNVYGGSRDSTGTWAELVSQNSQMANAAGSQNSSHTPRPARAPTSNTIGGRGGLMATPTGGSGTAEALDYASVTAIGGSGSLESGMGGRDVGDSQGDSGFHGEVIGGSGRQAVGNQRTGSPMPQASVIMRPPQVRGLSPSPMRNLAGLDSSWLQQQQQQRSGSPMQHQSSSAAVPGGATRGVSSAVGSLDGAVGGSQFWQSPRTASPSGGVFRASEVGSSGVPAYSRGRSHTRALSPAQLSVNAYSGSPTPQSQQANGMVRTTSPVAVAPSRQSGIAWSPVPPSPPAPKRSISPQPSIVVTGNQNNQNSVSSLRWIGPSP